MQIIIEILEKTYKQLKFLNKQGFGTVIDEAVANGTPLPKRHGDLKDMDNLKYVFDLTKDNPIYSGKDIERAIKSMITTIEADKEGES